MRDSRIYLHAIDQSQRIKQQQCIIKIFNITRATSRDLSIEFLLKYVVYEYINIPLSTLLGCRTYSGPESTVTWVNYLSLTPPTEPTMHGALDNLEK